MKKILILLGTLCGFSAMACEGEKYDQFDFWLGNWTVTTPAGKLAGTNQITQEMNNCVLHEQYSTPSGYQGSSFNIYDAVFDKWHQTWVDNSGTLLELDGGLVGKNMVLQGKGKDQQGNPVLHRISWTPNDDGTVRQHWQQSDDSGEHWTTLFDGLYTPTKNTNSEKK
ncbi:hypothetical protein [Neptunicella sp. SCSIO 80796]|uniref:hypothetical protein n=1 Tax=Neptunicella plasticusilytica TaxID=3117012 RepID=UPI003A4E2E41